MSKYVLDASALLAYLLNEEGGHRLEEYLKAGICMTTINWAEVLSKGSDLGENLHDLEILIKGYSPAGNGVGIKFFPATMEDAKAISNLRSATKTLGLSLGDRACLALALRLNLPAITADRSWLKLKQTIKIISLR